MPRNPAGMGMWRRDVLARNPDLGASVPAVVAGVPNPVAMLGRRGRNAFNCVMGRCDGNANLRTSVGDSYSKKERAG